MSDHIFMFTLVDDFVVVASWQDSGKWYTWGSFHIDAFWPEAKGYPWYKELNDEGVVIVNASISLNTSMQLPPDNLS